MPLSSQPLVRFSVALCVAVALSGCAGSRDISSRINDPYEQQNRAAHEANLALDRMILRPASTAYGTILPEPVQKGISNVAKNLNTPGDVLNNLLQVRLGQATHNTLRFAVNSTVGIGGLFDVATLMGLEERETDFGETLFYWGAPEGTYVEMPIAGPATSRQAVGRFVDFAINPTSLFIQAPESTISRSVSIADVFGSRYRNSDLIDGLLYESADSYAQARLLYLENRRHKLRSDSGAEADYLDPYADPYGDVPYADN